MPSIVQRASSKCVVDLHFPTGTHLASKTPYSTGGLQHMKRVLFSLVFIVAACTVGSAQSFTYYFPQVAVGAGWRTTIFLSNATASPASATVTFIGDNGGPFFNNWLDENGNNINGGSATFSVSL